MTQFNEAPITQPSLGTRKRVLIVEDHPMVRRGMRSVIDATSDLIVCGEAATVGAALEVYEQERPDVVLLDLMLAGSDGTELIRSIVRLDPDAKILVLSVKDEEAYAERCLRAGALGYSMKVESNDVLLNRLRRVAASEVQLSPRLAAKILNRVQAKPVPDGNKPLAALSSREMEVFHLIGMGFRTREIAERLNIGIKTVETYRENIKNKLALEHSAALVHFAVRWVQRSFRPDRKLD